MELDKRLLKACINQAEQSLYNNNVKWCKVKEVKQRRIEILWISGIKTTLR